MFKSIHRLLNKSEVNLLYTMINLNNVDSYKKIKLAIKYPTTSLNILSDFCRKIFLNQKITPFPRYIALYVTNRCNLNCPMCVNSSYRAKHLKQSEINLNLIKKILPELKKYKPFVVMSGGEPLINHDIFKIISLLSANKILTSLTTNGFVLEKYVKQIVNSRLEFITISLDHFEEEKHDQGRGVKTTYRRLIKGLNKLVVIRDREGTPTNIKVNTVIRKDNYRDLSKMYDFIEKLKIDEWALQHYSFINPVARKVINNYVSKNHIGNYIIGAEINSKSFFSKNQIGILQDQLNDIAKKSKYYKTRLSIKPNVDDLFSYYQGDFASKKSYCSWPFDSINIMESSKVTLCLGNEIGNLKSSHSINDMWQSQKANDFRELIIKEKVLPLCFRCCAMNYVFDK